MRAAVPIVLLIALAMLAVPGRPLAAGSRARTLATPAASPTPSPALEPATVVIDVTRCWPTLLTQLLPAARTCLIGDTAPLWLTGVPAVPTAGTHLSSDRGGTLALALGPAQPVAASPPTTPTTAGATPGTGAGTPLRGTLQVGDIGGSGRYEGDLLPDLGIAATAKIGVVVNVQDLFVWPLAALLLGAFIAWRLLWWRDVSRPKDLLRAAIKGAGDRYWADRRSLPADLAPAPLYTCDEAFPVPAEAGAPADPADGYPSEAECRAGRPGMREAAKLYCDVAAADTREGLDEVAARARDLAARADGWLPIYEATRRLDAALVLARRELEEVPDLLDRTTAGQPMPLFTASAQRLAPLPTAPNSAEETATLLAELEEQTGTVGRFREAWRLVRVGQPLYDELRNREGLPWDPAERRALHRHEPIALFAAYVLPAASAADLEDLGGAARLRAAYAELRALADAYLAPRPADIFGTPPGVAAVGQPVPPEPERRWDRRTPLQILAAVRRHDSRDFWATALVTTLAFMLMIYPGRNFASWDQYLGAFAAGAGGMLVVNWGLLPWYRSYQAAAAGAASPRAGEGGRA
ncbi:MAG TPA: hypothetical protein VFW96_06390 [Thermomicrobiales bacterium]|nr:hypothetical protein [Thermomicrobiales bacterium]